MKFLGLTIRREDQDKLVVRNIVPNQTPIAKIPHVKPTTLNYGQSFSYGRGAWHAGEYNLSEIGKVEDTDGFVRQAFVKKHGLMFKEGFTFSGPNKITTRYIKTRLAQIARATEIPTDELLKRLAKSLIRVSNAFLIKVRDPKASGGRERVTPNGKKLKPIAGYFPAAPETMRYELDNKTGKIVRWRQVLPDGQTWKEFDPEDVIHFTINKREGFIYGVPDLVPVIDDIRALRQIEENIELLLYQYLFPLYHYKVGTENAPAGYTEDGEREIDVVRSQIEYMPSEGALVTPERHEIHAIGAEGRAIRAEGYLDHFKKRVFAGLGVSSVDMGEGDTANRATAQTLSRQLIDTVKDIQDSLESQFKKTVIDDLLLESTFGDQVLEEENRVVLSFKEIDIQNQMEQEQHWAKMFEANLLTWDEARHAMGHEPILVPEDPEDQDPSKYPEWFNTNWKLFREPEYLIRAVDEPYSVAAKMAAEMRSTGTTQGQINQAKAEKEQEQKRAAEMAQATRAASAKSRTAPKDNVIERSFELLESDTAKRIRGNLLTRGHINEDILRSYAINWSSDTAEKVISFAYTEFVAGLRDQTGGLFYQNPDIASLSESARGQLRNRIDFFVNKLALDVISLIKRRVDSLSSNGKLADRSNDVLEIVHTAFDAVRFRAQLIWDVETRKAYNYGRVIGMRLEDQKAIKLVAAEGSCGACQAANGKLLELAAIALDDVPPLHANSRMTLQVADVAFKETPLQEPGKPAMKQDDPSVAKQTAICPECGHSAVLQRKTGTYYCARCNMGYSKTEVQQTKEEVGKHE